MLVVVCADNVIDYIYPALEDIQKVFERLTNGASHAPFPEVIDRECEKVLQGGLKSIVQCRMLCGGNL